MIIKVTQEHIDQGVRTSAWRCPIALALRDAYHTTDASATPVRLRVKEVAFKPPKIVINFMNKFDCERSVEPMEFEIDL